MCALVFQGQTKLHEPISKELTWKAERLVSKESWVEQGDYLPVNVSYQLLAGAPSTQQSERHTLTVLCYVKVNI